MRNAPGKTGGFFFGSKAGFPALFQPVRLSHIRLGPEAVGNLKVQPGGPAPFKGGKGVTLSKTKGEPEFLREVVNEGKDHPYSPLLSSTLEINS